MQRSVKTFITFTAVLFALILAGCGNQAENSTADESGQQATGPIEYPDVEENPTATMTMENDEKIVIEMYPDVAPNTVANFISLIEDGYYDGQIFHRVIPDFMIQGGDPNGNGTGDPGYTIPGEFSSNGFENDLIHERGIISMARSSHPDSAGSQFFIMVEDSPHLDGEYAAFGRVTEGMEAVDGIVAQERDSADKDQIMKEVVVDTKGYDYPEPEKMDNE
ncbi:peptidylprolyl isomerase [Oceanobacillus massiliensis]|uniref:peptidylprolyl isomerase n=1 Tax=Oceanobacillus massiliensis TaxID=1465765 RepID=UPI00028879B1|nr:peptidylprolyl isomerase [Oceanobacillus massiliensis]